MTEVNFMERRTLLKNARVSLIECIALKDGYRPGSEEWAEINRMIEWFERLLESKK